MGGGEIDDGFCVRGEIGATQEEEKQQGWVDMVDMAEFLNPV